MRDCQQAIAPRPAGWAAKAKHEGLPTGNRSQTRRLGGVEQKMRSEKK